MGPLDQQPSWWGQWGLEGSLAQAAGAEVKVLPRGGGASRILEAEVTGAVRRMRWKKRAGGAGRAEAPGKERVPEQPGEGAGERG